MSGNECIICSDLINDSTNIHNTLSCGHDSFFHKGCIDGWTKIQHDNGQQSECPICRKGYGNNDLSYNIESGSVSVSQADTSHLFDILKFSRHRNRVMIIIGGNVMMSLLNVLYGNSVYIMTLCISLIGYYGAKTLYKYWLFTYIVFNLLSLIAQSSLIPYIVDNYDQNTWIVYCVGLGIDLILLIYVGLFYRKISNFRNRMVELRSHLGIMYVYGST